MKPRQESTAEQPDPGKRVDPPRRQRIKAQDMGIVLNQSTERKYLLANPTCEHTGLQPMLTMGWYRVNHNSDPERIAGGRLETNGDVTWKGQVLIWLPIEEYNEIIGQQRDIMRAREATRDRPGGMVGAQDFKGRPAALDVPDESAA